MFILYNNVLPQACEGQTYTVDIKMVAVGGWGKPSKAVHVINPHP